ncbi:MAG TPA: molybdopterin molybdotransferase MoeA [candidate division Zixibacteria bacterium]|jgi:molybdopterin molybdotransferase|nr:molybdopterin molybdotransferase MoeA [Candidatus Latescibacterota bacterium]HIG46742.1 molybdopterin molybdotransferase MoeA [candidate division Zixibacteria bacterium]
MISVIEARDTILAQVSLLGTERVDLFSALDRVLSEDVYATRNQPPWDNSAMDGFAVRTADTLSASQSQPVIFKIIEDLPAGYRAKNKVEAGQAIRIMTGAPVPEGADTILRSEITERLDHKHIKLSQPMAPGTDLRKVGEDISDGALLLPVGTLIRPAEIGLLASTNRSVISVYRNPRVAILSTGDEIVDVDDEMQDGKIVDSNGYALSALVVDTGAEVVRLGICPDTQDALEQKLREALSFDVIITSGGVSVGEYDFVKLALDALGTTMEFWKVAMTPGRPLAFGMIQDTLAFGLPGNPVASMVTFELFTRPALLKMQGYSNLYRRTVRAILLEDINKVLGRKQFIRMQLQQRGDAIYASRTGAQGSGILRSMSLADGLAITHEDQIHLKAGDEIEVMLLGGVSDLANNRNC